ncbi:hypothetical protein ACFE04_021997 [Oxalis oulophora]
MESRRADSMADSKGSNIRNFMCSSKHALRPPKSPFPSVSPSYTEYVPNSVIGSRAIQKPRQGNSHHLRTSSESLLIEEQPSWLDDLLNEPETPVRKAGHRRSSSDSFTYVDVANVSNNVNYTALDDYRYKNLVSSPWGSQDFDYHHKDFRHAPFYPETNLAKPQKNTPWESAAKPMAHPSGLVFSKDNNVFQNSGKSGGSQEPDSAPSIETEKQNNAELDFHDSKALSEKDSSLANLSTSETDTKRAKQQFAQRSRVRKLQYIAELERNVQTLQAEGSEVSAELEFLNQQNLILSMENKALKHRLDSLAQEQLIKYLEQDVLEREIGRLRSLYQQQQQQPPQQQPSSSHRRSTSRDLDSQFANLSLKQKDTTNSGRDPVTAIAGFQADDSPEFWFYGSSGHVVSVSMLFVARQGVRSNPTKT